MDSYTPLKTPHDVTDVLVNRIHTSLVMNRVAFLRIDDGKNIQRVVLAALPESEEIMVGMEGGGCIFIDRTSNINPFVFVTAGFQLTPAQIITKLFVGIAVANAELEQAVTTAYPQLTHQ